MKTTKLPAVLAGLMGLVVLAFGARSFGQTEQVINGGFELGSQNWSVNLASGANFTTNAPNHSGITHLAISTLPGVTQIVAQTVNLPANSIAASFTCFFNIQPTDGALVDNAQMSVFITDAAGTTVLTNVVTLDNIDRDTVQGTYHQVSCDLTPFVTPSGRQVQVQFRVLAAGDARPGGTIFNFDDVSVLAVDISARAANDNFANAAVLTTNVVGLYATNTYATKEPGEPRHAGNPGGHSLWWTWTAPAYGTFSINTDGSDFDTVLAAYTGTSVSNLTVVASNDNDNGGQSPTSAISFKVTPGTQYQIAVDGAGGATGVVRLSLNFKPDTTAPTISFTSPASGAKVASSTLTVTGTANDNQNVALVIYRLENANGTNDYLPATGTNHWSATVTNLMLGLNTIRVRAFDTSSNMSPAIARSVTYVLGANYSLTINGTGTVSPDLSKQLLEVGKTYTLTAKPGNGFVFSNWTGTISSSAAKLTFAMQSNTVLQANFIPNPFIPAKGTYAGLFTNSTPETNSGFFSATVMTTGKFSSRVQTGGHTYSLSGQFAVDGSYSNSIARRGQTPLSVQLQLDLAGGDVITGTIADGDQVADLLANRAVYSRTANPAPLGGHKYTLAIAPAVDASTAPGGYGFGAVSIDASGNLNFSGTLGDGTKVSQRTFVSKDGTWPLYLSLYANHGALFGWLTFTNDAGGDLEGTVTWSKPGQTKSKLYPNPFALEGVEVMGSAYAFTNGQPVFNPPAGSLFILESGNLSAGLSIDFQVGANNKVTGTNKLAVTIAPTTGLFKGSVLSPDTGKPISVSGAILQSFNAGFGCFLGTNQSGTVYMGPVP